MNCIQEYDRPRCADEIVPRMAVLMHVPPGNTFLPSRSMVSYTMIEIVPIAQDRPHPYTDPPLDQSNYFKRIVDFPIRQVDP